MPSIGQQLSLARKTRDLSIEDVAFHTRIPPGRVRDMENDDLSRFANLTYARGFLQIYSRFLELDISDYLSQFSSADFATASGHEYVQTATATHNLPAAVFTDYGKARHPGLYVLLAAVAATGGLIWWSNRGKTPDTRESTRPEASEASSRPAPADSVSPSLAPAPPPLPAAVEKSAPEPPAKPPKATVVEDDDEGKKEP